MDTEEIFLDEDADTPKIMQKYPEILPIWVVSLFGYDIPIYNNVGWFRRILMKIVTGCSWRKVR